MLRKKVLIGILSLLSVISFGKDSFDISINKLEEISQKYEKNISALNQISNIRDNKNDSENIKNRLSIISGKSTAGLKISTEFNYYRTSIYEIFTKPQFTTGLKFSSDENILYVGGGDTENWQLDETKGGSDNSTYLFIMPRESNLKTNLNIVTDKRTYFITLYSTENNYNPFVEWNYPYEASMKFNRKNNVDEISLNVKSIDNLKFGYRYNKSKSFAPVEVFSDGEKTILVMSDKLQELPTVYGYGADNQLSLINSRYLKNRIIIDKVVDKIQLVLGKEKLEIRR